MVIIIGSVAFAVVLNVVNPKLRAQNAQYESSKAQVVILDAYQRYIQVGPTNQSGYPENYQYAGYEVYNVSESAGAPPIGPIPIYSHSGGSGGTVSGPELAQVIADLINAGYERQANGPYPDTLMFIKRK